jgi:hypothetical protein
VVKAGAPQGGTPTPAPSPPRFTWVAPASVAILAAAFAIHRIEDFDVWFHLAAARLMVATGSWPASNTFALTAPDFPWIDLHWIFQLLLYGAWSIAGENGAIGLAAALMAITSLVLYGLARRYVPPLLAAFLIALALAISFPRFVPRPELLSFLYFAVYLVVLEGLPRNGRAIFLLVPLQILWTNTQGIFAVGLALIGCYWVGAALAFLPLPRGWRQASGLSPAEFGRFTLVFALATLACLLNPWGLDGALFPFHLLPRVTGNSLFSARIGEFRPPLEAGYAPILVKIWIGLLVATAASFLVNVQRWHLGRVLAAAAFGYLSTRSLRNMAFFGWIAVPVIAANVGPALARLRLPRTVRGGLAGATVAGLVLFLGAIVTNQFYAVMKLEREFGLGVSRVRFPADAIAFIERVGITGRAFNCLAMGGYLAWSRPNDQVFVDGRLEAFPEAVFRRYFQAMDQPDAWPQLIGSYQLDYALLYHGWSNRLPLVNYLAADHGWTIVYYDEIASIFVPSDEAHRQMRERALIAFADVRNARRRAPAPEPPGVWERRLSVPLAETWRQRSYGNLLRSLGLPAEAVAAYQRSLALDPSQTDPRTSLGLAYWSLGRRDDAILAWRQVLSRDPADARAQQLLSSATGGGTR